MKNSSVRAVALYLLCSFSILTVAQTPSNSGPSKGKVQQTITKTEFVDGANLQADTTFKAKANLSGLTHICHLYGEAPSGGSAHHGSGSCAFPLGFKIDRHYQQSTINCCGGGASSPIRPGDIPPGIDIEVDGGYYWAVLPPVKLLALQYDDNNVVTQWGVFIGDLYCGPGAAGQPGCNIKVDVYAKPK